MAAVLLPLVSVVAGQRPAAAAVTAVRGEACTYFVNVGLFGGPQDRQGCGEAGRLPAPNAPGGPAAPGASDGSYSPHVALPASGSGGTMTASDANGASAVYGPAVIHGGIWPESATSAPPSGPQFATTSGTPASGSVTSQARIDLHATPITVGCYTGFTPPCTAPGGFGPFPVEGETMNVQCTANEAGVSGSTTFTNATLATSTTPDGEPLAVEPVPDNPPPNYTRHGVITNVGDVFTVVYNQQIRNSDGSITVIGTHMYLYGPTAIGEVVRGVVTCGTTPSASAPADTLAPTCGPPVVKPVSPEDQTPQVPYTELIGAFDAGRGGNTGIASVTNIKAVNGTVRVGDPSAPFNYLKFVPGQTGPLPITATKTVEALPMYWSFTVTDSAGNSTNCAGKVAPPALSPVAFHPLTPARILDSRAGTPWSQGEVRNVQVTGGAGGVPSGAAAVVLNATVTGTTGPGFLTIWPTGQPQPTASSLNWAPGQTIANAVTVKVGTGGNVSVLNPVGSTHVIFDVVGYYDSLAGDGYTSLTPARILDSRSGTPWGVGETRDVTVAGAGGVPPGADAVVLNVTVTGTTQPGFLTIWPAGQARPTASSLNWAPGQTIPNAVTVKVGAAGRISVYNAVGSAHVIIDVVGSFAPGTGQLFHPLTAPARIQDSRPGIEVGRYNTPWGTNTTRDVEVGTLVSGPPVPATATAALLNVTVTGTSGTSFLTIWPSGQSAPNASSLNWAAGNTIANAVTTKLGAGGEISVMNNFGQVHVIADIAGWYG